MSNRNPLPPFFRQIQHDPRISVTHIGVFAALAEHWRLHHRQNPVHAFSHEIMQLAKITASKTYHKCIRDLHRFGYLRYEPSFNRNKGSRVYLNLPDKINDNKKGLVRWKQ
jgi:hypothetical protein